MRNRYPASLLEPVTIPTAKVPLSTNAFRRIQKLASGLRYISNEKAVPGGVAKSQRVLLSDADRTTDLTPEAEDLLKTAQPNEMLELFGNMLRAEQVQIVRCQVNRMREGQYIDLHKHRNATLSVVLSVKECLSGGHHFYEVGGARKQVALEEGALVISGCGVGHGVSRVKRGNRITLIWFIK